MAIEVLRVGREEVRGLRDAYREAAHCQIISFSAVERGNSNPWLLKLSGEVAGYGAVWNRYYEGGLHELYVLPPFRPWADRLLRALIRESKATNLQVQSNAPLLNIYGPIFANALTADRILFQDTERFGPPLPDEAKFERVLNPEPNHPDSRDFVLRIGTETIATGGYLCHYNAPYADVHMDVAPNWRRQGVGSAFVAAVRRAAWSEGKVPAARCDVQNVPSRRTLEQGGFQACGAMLAGPIYPHRVGESS